MWLPVLRSEELTRDPMRVIYWGTPVVVFRTTSGRLGALEDLCGHRGIPLSCGSIRGENIRCDFHHFRFNTDGDCVNIPSVFRADDAFQRKCGVRKFHVREELGLIWISIEDETAAPFPVDLAGLPEDRILVTGAFDIGGDIRVWMDHYLDMPHFAWAHAESSFFASPERPAAIESPVIGVRADSTYPARPGVELDFHIRDDGPSADFALSVRLLLLLANVRRRLSGRARKERVYRMHARADLLTPVCQDTWLTMGRMPVRIIASVNPIAEGKNRFVYTSVADGRGQGRLGRMLARRLMRDSVLQHLAIEDGQMIAQARYVECEQLRATEFDQTILAMRSMFANYQREKAKLYPEGSMMHSLEYGPDRSIAPSADNSMIES
ncbi:hypothetical protein NRB20_43590 [Nocardia sp. RB20]|uniref:Rieske domain-containing protein n=2 Tax=Nocardia macrotermitis TaxID=2585198 RepID=A0A7K0D6A2_9NOCA|nr:hypothetical protein [Nocardia macrotermitis]